MNSISHSRIAVNLRLYEFVKEPVFNYYYCSMKGKKIKIGFDLDGVLLDHKNNRLKAAEMLGYKDFSERTPVEEFKSRMLASDYEKMQEYFYDEATPDIMSGVEELWKELGDCELYIISRRRKLGSRAEALKRLGKNINFVPENVFFVEKDEDKNRVIKKFGIDIFIDDRLSILETIDSAERFLFDEFGVYKTQKLGDITVVHSHKELLEIFLKIG